MGCAPPGDHSADQLLPLQRDSLGKEMAGMQRLPLRRDGLYEAYDFLLSGTSDVIPVLNGVARQRSRRLAVKVVARLLRS